jgi:hypothetical protein
MPARGKDRRTLEKWASSGLTKQCLASGVRFRT